ncbi:MAG: hypothetical protein QOC76_4310 [Mycobacterium sp.]|nr:hypothetical protein [Mycobacterium sp.]
MSVGLSVMGIAAAVGLGLEMIDAIATRARAQDLRNAGPAGVCGGRGHPGAAHLPVKHGLHHSNWRSRRLPDGS